MTVLRLTLVTSLDLVLRVVTGSFELMLLIFQGVLPPDAPIFRFCPALRGCLTRHARDVSCFVPLRGLTLLKYRLIQITMDGKGLVNDGSVRPRLEFWALGMELIKESPILGTG
jgi:hypothetical protein